MTGSCCVWEWELKLSGKATFESQLPPGLAMLLVLFLPQVLHENRATVPASEAGVSTPLHDQEGTLNCHYLLLRHLP